MNRLNPHIEKFSLDIIDLAPILVTTTMLDHLEEERASYLMITIRNYALIVFFV